MKIFETEMLPEFEYFPQTKKKVQLVLHHTVSSVGKYVDDWFKEDKGKSRVAVAYVVDKNGDIFQLFDPSNWAYHIGGDSTAKQNQNSIGIELVNEGQLFKRANGSFYWWIDKDNPEGRFKYEGEIFELDEEWRGEKYFATYTKEQIDALYELVESLFQRFPHIKRRNMNHFNVDKSLHTWKGVVMHCNLREDKFDLSPAFNIENFTEFVSNYAISESVRKIKIKKPEYIKYVPENNKQQTTKEGLDV